jgi:hypothetical protein
MVVDCDFVQKLYHTDFDSSNKKFINEGELLLSTDDKYWCGDGMYFWDNKSNAVYWRQKKKAKFPNKRFSICMASLRCNSNSDLLDLTDRETANDFKRIAEHYRNSLPSEYRPTFQSYEYGAMINFVRNSMIKDGRDTFNVVKVIGSYGIDQKNYLIRGNDNFYKRDTHSFPHITTQAKVIYSVWDYSLLSDCKIIRE